MLKVVYPECRHAECHYAKCRGAFMYTFCISKFLLKATLSQKVSAMRKFKPKMKWEPPISVTAIKSYITSFMRSFPRGREIWPSLEGAQSSSLYIINIFFKYLNLPFLNIHFPPAPLAVKCLLPENVQDFANQIRLLAPPSCMMSKRKFAT